MPPTTRSSALVLHPSAGMRRYPVLLTYQAGLVDDYPPFALPDLAALPPAHPLPTP